MLEEMRKLRKQKGLSMKQLGEMVGLAEVTISTYETGRSEPSLDALCAIADVLDVSLDYLVRGKEKDRPEERSMEAAISRFENYSPAQLRELGSLITYLQYRKERELSEGQDSAGSP